MVVGFFSASADFGRVSSKQKKRNECDWGKRKKGTGINIHRRRDRGKGRRERRRRRERVLLQTECRLKVVKVRKDEVRWSFIQGINPFMFQTNSSVDSPSIPSSTWNVLYSNIIHFPI